jgi:hypothetical protein
LKIDSAIKAIEAFQGRSLTLSLSSIENEIVGLGAKGLVQFCGSRRIDCEFMASAASIKQVAGQINVIIHAAGILCSLPQLLKPGEVVQSVSLGAGNTGRRFDLETNRRIAEFKFIDWRGGSESIRQNSIFKDFFELAEYETAKSKHLYVVGTSHPVKFLESGRALTSVLSRRPETLKQIGRKYGAGVVRVRDYYALKSGEVEIYDISHLIGRV